MSPPPTADNTILLINEESTKKEARLVKPAQANLNAKEQAFH
jgi:hypothetical protein